MSDASTVIGLVAGASGVVLPSIRRQQLRERGTRDDWTLTRRVEVQPAI